MGWIGVDFDGTLAHHTTWKGGEHLGEPIRRTVNRVRNLLRRGYDVRIFTSRVGVTGETNALGETADEAFAARQRELIEAWCEAHIGRKLPVTAQKDFNLLWIYDDRCTQLEPNTGVMVAEGYEVLP